MPEKKPTLKQMENKLNQTKVKINKLKNDLAEQNEIKKQLTIEIKEAKAALKTTETTKKK